MLLEISASRVVGGKVGVAKYFCTPLYVLAIGLANGMEVQT
jgi:hypothetical protein